MSIVLHRLMLVAHAGVTTLLLLFLSSAGNSPIRWSQVTPAEASADVITSPELQGYLPLV